MVHIKKWLSIQNVGVVDPNKIKFSISQKRPGYKLSFRNLAVKKNKCIIE